jgi:hypothetical protein
MSDHIDTIIAGLSDAQKRAVLWLPADGSKKDHRRGGSKNDRVSETSLYMLDKRVVGDPKKRLATIYTLVEHSLHTGAKEHGQIWANTQYWLTPLGQKVRARLGAAA